jgi:hypothetical protein
MLLVLQLEELPWPWELLVEEVAFLDDHIEVIENNVFALNHTIHRSQQHSP